MYVHLLVGCTAVLLCMESNKPPADLRGNDPSYACPSARDLITLFRRPACFKASNGQRDRHTRTSQKLGPTRPTVICAPRS